MVDQERSTLFIKLKMGFGMIGCVFSVTVISMLNKIISIVNQYIPHKNSMREGGAICLELIKAEAKRYGSIPTRRIYFDPDQSSRW